MPSNTLPPPPPPHSSLPPPPPLPLPSHNTGDKWNWGWGGESNFSEFVSLEQLLHNVERAEREERSKRPIKSHHHRAAYAFQQNAHHMVNFLGRNQCGFLTLTCHPNTTLADARKSFTKFSKSVGKRFMASLSTLDVGRKSGGVHIHALVALPFDLREGFNFANYLEMQELSKLGALTPEQEERRRFLGQNLTINSELKRIWGELPDPIRAAGFAPRFELTPIREEPELAINYLLGGYFEVVRAVAGKKSRVRILSRSRNDAALKLFWPWQSNFRWVNSTIRSYFRLIGNALGLPYEEMKVHFGPRWSFHIRPALDQLIIDDKFNLQTWTPDQIRALALRHLRPETTSPFFEEAYRLGPSGQAEAHAAENGELSPESSLAKITNPERDLEDSATPVNSMALPDGPAGLTVGDGEVPAIAPTRRPCRRQRKKATPPPYPVQGVCGPLGMVLPDWEPGELERELRKACGLPPEGDIFVTAVPRLVPPAGSPSVTASLPCLNTGDKWK